MEPLKAIHLLLEAEESFNGERVRFFQGIVLCARDFEHAKERAVEVLARNGQRLVSIDPEETREVNPESVGYGNARPEEGIVALSGRIWVKPKDALPGVLAKLKRLIRRAIH